MPECVLRSMGWIKAETAFSMFGTDRAIKDFLLEIHPLADPAEQGDGYRKARRRLMYSLASPTWPFVYAIRWHSASALPHPIRTVNTLWYMWSVAAEQRLPPL
jgi:hypothetical protein